MFLMTFSIAYITKRSGWRIRTNAELQAMCRKPNIVTIKNVRRLQWAGHLVRMSHDRTAKKVFLGKADGRRSRKTKINVARLYWESP
jgi:predicted deacetylase